MGNFNGVAILITSSGRSVDIDWSLSLPSFQYPIGMSVAWFLAKGQDRGPQRDALAKRAVEIGAPYMFFLDDDTICPNYTIQQLHYQLNQNDDAAVCGGIYFTKSSTPEPLVFKELEAGPYWKWKLGDVFPCKGLGTGCMMIRTECLKNIPEPWFVDTQEAPVGQTVDYNGVAIPQSKKSGTDDLFFCRKVSDAGYVILAHGGVLPVHVDQDGKQYSMPLDSYPCREWKEQIEEARAAGKSAMTFTAKTQS